MAGLGEKVRFGVAQFFGLLFGVLQFFLGFNHCRYVLKSSGNQALVVFINESGSERAMDQAAVKPSEPQDAVNVSAADEKLP